MVSNTKPSDFFLFSTRSDAYRTPEENEILSSLASLSSTEKEQPPDPPSPEQPKPDATTGGWVFDEWDGEF